MPSGFFQSGGDDGDFKSGCVQLGHGNADSIDGDRPFQDDLSDEFFWHLKAELRELRLFADGGDFAQAVDMALHDMATKTALCTHGPFQINWRAAFQRDKGCFVDSFGADIEFGDRSVQLTDRQAHAINGDTVAQVRPIGNAVQVDCQPHLVAARPGLSDDSNGFNDSCKHRSFQNFSF